MLDPDMPPRSWFCSTMSPTETLRHIHPIELAWLEICQDLLASHQQRRVHPRPSKTSGT